MTKDATYWFLKVQEHDFSVLKMMFLALFCPFLGILVHLRQPEI